MQTIVNLLRGFCEIHVTGPFPERFINICAKNDVELWALKRVEGGYTARIRQSHAKQAALLSERSMCEVKITRTRGAPKAAEKTVRRTGFVIGMVICVAFVWLMSLRVWDFEVVGNKSVPDEKILSVLRGLGVGVGTARSDIKSDILQTEMLLQIPELRWLAVNLSGSRAFVEVRERVAVPEIVPEKTPANIVARLSGVIEHIAVLEGAAQVAAGDVVEAGQLLASGIVDTTVGVRLVHAMANVEARTYYTLEAATPLLTQYKLPTGEVKTRYAIIIGKTRINLSFATSIFGGECDKMTMRTRLELPGGLFLPVVWEKSEYVFYDTRPGEQASIDAEEYLTALLLEKLDDLSNGAKPVRTDFAFDERDGMLYATLYAECLEDIAETVVIPVDETIARLLEG